jgi:sortase (surface protein transpeptidase)
MSVLHQSGRRGLQRLAAATAALILAACGGTATDPGQPDSSRGTAAATTSTPMKTPPAAAPPTTGPAATDPAPSPQPAIDHEAADPVAVEVPAIGVNAPVVPLGLEPSGALEVPRDARQTGWWTGGPEPGERGPAVVAGHVDSRVGPAVFYRLRELRPGDPITVRRADGSRVQFAVQRSEQHPKAAFPTDSVYTPTTGAELRLITCGGSFDRSSGHYVDNLIVYAQRT